MNTLYKLSACAIVCAIIFLGGMYVGTKIIGRLNDNELTELADDYESDLRAVHDEYRETVRLLEQANRYLEESAIERESETVNDKQRISDLEGTVERLQTSTGSAFMEIKGAEETVQRIEEATSGIREDVQGIRKRLQEIQRSKRDEDWFTFTREHNPEDWWRRLISRYNRDFLYRDF